MNEYCAASETLRLNELDGPWGLQNPQARIGGLRSGALRLAERLKASGRVVAVRTLPLGTLLYPTKYAFWGAAWSPAPFVVMTHRALLVQFFQQGRLKHLLFNPTNVVASRQTPYFKRIVDMVGPKLAYEVLTTRHATLSTQLALLGLGAADIDYVAFDHFHTQDLRPLLGTTDGRFSPLFPNAKLLAPKVEWDTWDSLHPMQRAWFIADGRQGVRTEKVVLTERDLLIGDGVMLLRTPGHTLGNQTLFVNTESGIWGCSENGTCADNYTPHESSIAGLKQAAVQGDLDVIINANTPEGGALQYDSMLVEKTICDSVSHAPGFVQMFASSEITPSPLAPLVRPRVLFGGLSVGQLSQPLRKKAKKTAGGETAQKPLA